MIPTQIVHTMPKPKRTNSRLFRAPAEPRDRMTKKADDVEAWLDTQYRSQLEANWQREDLGRRGWNGGRGGKGWHDD